MTYELRFAGGLVVALGIFFAASCEAMASCKVKPMINESLNDDLDVFTNIFVAHNYCLGLPKLTILKLLDDLSRFYTAPLKIGSRADFKAPDCQIAVMASIARSHALVRSIDRSLYCRIMREQAARVGW